MFDKLQADHLWQKKADSRKGRGIFIPPPPSNESAGRGGENRTVVRHPANFGRPADFQVTFQLGAAKECHSQRSEAISLLWGLFRRFTPRNDKSTPCVTEESHFQRFFVVWRRAL
jgi:hypothetical protein